MTKNEAKQALLNGAHMHWHRGVMGMRAEAYINGQRVRIDTASALIQELQLRGERQDFLLTHFTLPA